MAEIIKFLKVREVKSPSRANQYDAGIDFYIPEFSPEFLKDLKDKNPDLDYDVNNGIVILGVHKRILIPSGIHCQMAAPGRALIAANKSGVSTKHGLVYGAQVVDYEYQGEIHLSLINTGEHAVILTPGMKIIQFLETPIYNSEIIVDSSNTVKTFYSEETTRGAGGFGSSDDSDPNPKRIE